MEITKQSVIGDVLDFAPETAEFFFEIGTQQQPSGVCFR